MACKTDRVDARVLAELSFRDLVPAIWLATPELRQERERSRWRLHLVKHRSILKNRVHASLIAFGHQVPMADLFGAGGRRLLAELDFPEPWLGHVRASVELIDDLDRRIGEIERWLQRSGADHRYIPLLMSAPGDRVGHRFHDRRRDRGHQPVRIAGQAVRVHRPVPARERDRRHGPSRAAVQARPQVTAVGADGSRDPRLDAPALPRALPAHQRRLGRQRGAKVAQIELARKPTEATGTCSPTTSRFQALRSGRRHFSPDCLTVPFLTCAAGASPDNTWSSKLMKR